jgi:predicted O-methyltransferase YrrM
MLRYARHVDRLLARLFREWEAASIRRLDLPQPQLRREIASAEGELLPFLADYCREVSTPEMAVSLRSAALLAALCRLSHPRRILDTGSGFSSFVLRRVAPASEPPQVWSVDDDARWLARTAAFLRRHGLPEGRLLAWEDFVTSGERDFDLIFHDLGRAERIRLDVLPDVCRRLARRGLLLLDDFHKRAYRGAARRILSAAGLAPVPLRHHTLDGFGRFAALARMAA